MTPTYWQDAKDYLSNRDTVLDKIISEYDGEELNLRPNAFHTLARAIVGQQISVKAADSVWKKYENLIGADPEKTIESEHDDLRSCGLSNQKTNYLKNIAEYVLERHPEYQTCHPERSEGSKKILRSAQNDIYKDMTDEEVIDELCTIKGVGRWTAEMFLMFHLGRADLFPIKDLGLIKAIEKHYDIPRDELVEFSKKWQPYRTVATWYLWRSLDPVPVEY